MEINSNNVQNFIRCIVIRPKEVKPVITEITLTPVIKDKDKENEYPFDINSFEKDIREILNITDKSKSPLFTSLADPLQDFLLVLNPDMIDNDSEYNFGYIGSPLFGNVVIIQTKMDENQDEATEESMIAKIIPMEEKVAEVLQTFFESNKDLERKSGVYDSIVNEIKRTSKKDFIQNILKDNIEAGNYTEQ